MEADEYLLVIDDDPTISMYIGKVLGLRTVQVGTWSKIERDGPPQPRAVFLDINLGCAENGISHIPKLQALWPHIPIFVITARTEVEDIGDALAFGAHDFLRKPIQQNELRARYGARLREIRKTRDTETSQYSDLILFSLQSRIEGPSGEAFLSPSEKALLHALMEASETTLSRSEIAKICWSKVTVADNSINKKIHKIRGLLALVGSTLEIETVYGEGFRLSKGECHVSSA